jgi:hypothetical protein
MGKYFRHGFIKGSGYSLPGFAYFVKGPCDVSVFYSRDIVFFCYFFYKKRKIVRTLGKHYRSVIFFVVVFERHGKMRRIRNYYMRILDLF